MSGKKFVILLAVLGLGSLVVSTGLSILFRSAPQPAPRAGGPPGAAPSKEAALLASMAAAEGARDVLPKQQHLEQLIKELRVKIANYQRKESKLAEREKRLALAEENLGRRAKELENLMVQLVAPLGRLEKAQAELLRTRTLVDKQEKANILRIAATFEKMDPSEGSGILEGMCINKQTDDVVKILYYMSERASANVLAEMKDKALAARLTGLMKKVSEQS